MGTLLGRELGARGHSVTVLERDDPIEGVASYDVVMVSVPMTEAAAVTRALGPLVRPDALLCDVNSLKVEVCAALAASRGEALGTHPMFGPTVGSLRRQKIVLCPIKPGPMAAWFEAELGRMGAELIIAAPEQHDAMMAVVQVLTHFGIMVMGRALSQSGHALDASLPFTSPIYRLELAMVGRLFSQKPELYREILMRNPGGAAMRQVFLDEAAALCRLIDGGDGDAFVRAFNEVRDYFANFSDEAMALSDHIIDTVMARP
jgi:prephenate dehydrogenase